MKRGFKMNVEVRKLNEPNYALMAKGLIELYNRTVLEDISEENESERE